MQKKEDVVYEGASVKETIEIDKIYMQEGINNAIISAYKLAGKEIQIKNEILKVTYVLKDSKSNLKINDEITGSIAKVLNDSEINELKSKLELENNDLVLIISGPKKIVKSALGQLRL